MLTIFAKKKSILDVRLGSAYAPEENFGQLIWVKVFKNGLSKICIRQPLKNADHGLPIMVCLSSLSSTNFTWSIPEYLDPYLQS